MPGKISLYDVGGGGVQLVKSPFQLADNEATQLQNAELLPDQGQGGEGTITKRGGLQALNATPLAGSIVGLHGVTLASTYTRTLYTAKGTATANTWMTTTDGTSWTDSAGPLVAADLDKFTDANGSRDARRVASIKGFIVYPGNAYTKGTDNPPVVLWDGTSSYTTVSIPVGPSATAATPAYAITDWLVNDGVLYLAVHDPGGSAPALAGRVLSLDLTSGYLAQVAAAFGNGATEQAGGYPASLCWYQNQIFVGLNGSNTTDGIGTVVRCYPSVDAAWTTDVSNLSSYVGSMAVYGGDLYAGTHSSASSNAKVYKRSATAGTWAASFTSGGGTTGSAHVASLIVYGSNLYGVEYYSGVTDVVHIKKWDGSSWTTDRDVDNLDSLQDPPQLPGMTCLYGDDLYVCLRSTTATATDGFILRLHSGSWSKVVTNNFGGPMAVLTVIS